MVQINIEIKKKHLYFLVALITILSGLTVAIAYNVAGTGGNPSVMGHSVDEIDWSQPIPDTIGTAGWSPDCPNPTWGCGVHTWDVWAEGSVRASMICLGGGADTGQTGDCITEWPSGSSNVYVTSGEVADGTILSLPSGYTWNNCRVITSVRLVAGSPSYNRVESIGFSAFDYATHKVRVGYFHVGTTTGAVFGGTANYLMICVK